MKNIKWTLVCLMLSTVLFFGGCSCSCSCSRLTAQTFMDAWERTVEHIKSEDLDYCLDADSKIVLDTTHPLLATFGNEIGIASSYEVKNTMSEHKQADDKYYSVIFSEASVNAYEYNYFLKTNVQYDYVYEFVAGQRNLVRAGRELSNDMPEEIADAFSFEGFGEFVVKEGTEPVLTKNEQEPHQLDFEAEATVSGNTQNLLETLLELDDTSTFDIQSMAVSKSYSVYMSGDKIVKAIERERINIIGLVLEVARLYGGLTPVEYQSMVMLFGSTPLYIDIETTYDFYFESIIPAVPQTEWEDTLSLREQTPEPPSEQE